MCEIIKSNDGPLSATIVVISVSFCLFHRLCRLISARHRELDEYCITSFWSSPLNEYWRFLPSWNFPSTALRWIFDESDMCISSISRPFVHLMNGNINNFCRTHIYLKTLPDNPTFTVVEREMNGLAIDGWQKEKKQQGLSSQKWARHIAIKTIHYYVYLFWLSKTLMVGIYRNRVLSVLLESIDYIRFTTFRFWNKVLIMPKSFTMNRLFST